MTTLKVNSRGEFVNNFLVPISKLTENTVIKVRPDELNAVSSSSDGTLIVNCAIGQSNQVDETLFLNVPDINKLIKVMSCIADDDVELKFNNNNLEYRSNSVGFKYHLLEDGIIDPPAVDINKIKQIDFTFKFSMTPAVVNQLIKASTFTTDTNKIYFTTKDGGVEATLTDRQRHNVDSYSQQVADEYKGEALTKELALSFETVRILSSIRFDQLVVHVNPDLNVYLFQIIAGNATITIISSGYVG